MTSRTRRLILAGLAASVLAPVAALAADAPKVIRIGLPLVGTGNRPVGGSWNFADARAAKAGEPPGFRWKIGVA